MHLLRIRTTDDHRLCRQHVENPEVPQPQSGTEEKLRKLRETLEQREGQEKTDDHLSIGIFFLCEGNGAQAIAHQTVEQKHLRLLQAFNGTKLLVQDRGTQRTIRVENNGKLLGIIETGTSASSSWKGDLLRILQVNGPGLLVDHLQSQDYKKAMSLESSEFSDHLLSRLDDSVSQSQKQRTTSNKELAKALGTTADLTVLSSPQAGTEILPSTTQLLVMETEKPGTPLAVIEVGKRYVAGPEAHISRVRAMNDHPLWENIPQASVVAFMRHFLNINTPLRSPYVEMKTKNDEKTLRLFDTLDQRIPVLVAEITLSARSGAIVRKSIHKTDR